MRRWRDSNSRQKGSCKPQGGFAIHCATKTHNLCTTAPATEEASSINDNINDNNNTSHLTMGMFTRRIKFSSLAIVLQVVFILVMGLLCEYPDRSSYPGLSNNNNNNTDSHGGETTVGSYNNFQDTNVMIFVGFGFLMTFLKNYGYSSVGFNLLISVVCIQWAFIVRGFIHADILGGDKFHIGVMDMVTADFATATVLISFGAVLGKTSPVQLLVMAIFEIVFAQINEYIGLDKLHVRDLGESMFIHLFGAYFGLAVSRVLHNPEVEESEKEGSVYYSDIFAMIGRFDMVHVQNATLAGGVAVGASAAMPMEPFGAMIVGSLAGAISVLGYKYLTPKMASMFKIHDTCGVHNLHGMPGVLAAIVAACLAAVSRDWNKKDQAAIFPETFSSDELDGGKGRSAYEQGGYQFLAAVITFGFAIVSGTFTGSLKSAPLIFGYTEESHLRDREPSKYTE
ncbi:ammonium transporter rh type b-b [Plakobranchus ocellatus]|uniref:Ammonium transporter rh type b-b n=1 Tax=Plakobranchus ocellatus TaxID=259542 RepID=A0AAV3YSM5_9GAST|nr:ammonium transporter rh type b-b [Plakobranchus ocellatus]